MLPFGARVAALRQAEGLSQQVLATAVGVTRSHLAHLERAQRADDTPSHEVVVAVSRVFQVRTDALLRADWPPPVAGGVQLMIAPVAPIQGIPAKLRVLRVRAGLTQTALARELGLAHPATVSNLEARRRAGLPLLVRLADRFAVTLDWWLDDTAPAAYPVAVPRRISPSDG